MEMEEIKGELMQEQKVIRYIQLGDAEAMFPSICMALMGLGRSGSPMDLRPTMPVSSKGRPCR